MIRTVLDTNTLVSAVINIGSSVAAEIYQNCKDNHFVLVISPQILSELDEVLHREKVIKAHKRSDKELQEIMNGLSRVSLSVTGNFRIEVVRDPSDDKILSAALEGKADYIVSRDRDLLDLNQYQGIKIITPEEFMGILRANK